MTDEEIKTVRDAYDLAELVGEDVNLRARGSRQWACCPFHDERTPSFMVDEQSQRYRCFGCGAHGDAIDYVMQRHGVPFVEAVTFLADRAGIDISQGRGGKNRPSRERLLAAVALASQHTRSILDGDGEDAQLARAWITARGIDDAAMERWGIGYAPGGGALCHALREAGFTDHEMRSSGMCHGHGDALYRIICAPVRDTTGRAIGLAGQTPGGHGKAFASGIPSLLKTTHVGAGGVSQPKVTCHGALFGLVEAREAIHASGKAIVTLGPLNAIALHERGVRNAVSCMGGGLGTSAARALAAAGAMDITLLFPTNRQAALAAEASLGTALSVPARLSLARVEGDDTLATLQRLATVDIERLCDGAPEIIEATLEDIVERFDLNDPQALIDAAEKACSAFVTAVGGDRVRAGLIARQVADRLDICDPTTLVHALLADGPVGRPETIPGIDPSLVENPRRALPMVHFTIDFPAPTSPSTTLAQEALGARVASDALAIGTRPRHGREPPSACTSP